MATSEEILQRVKTMRSQISLADAYVCRFDVELDVDSFNNFLIWDDKNLLLHVLTENTEIHSQAECPFKIKSIGYDRLEFIHKLYSDNPVN